LILIVLIIGYFSVVFGLNLLLLKRVKHVQQFFIARQHFGPWAIAISFVASWFGAASTLGQVQKLGRDGLSGLWALTIPSIIACLFIWRVLAKRVASQPFLSLPQAMAFTYGPWVKVGLAFTILVSVTAFIGAELLAASLLITHVTGLAPVWATLGFGLLVVGYSAMAGFWTVVLTDWLHFALFTLGVGVMCAWVLTLPAEPLFHVWQTPPQPGFWQLNHQLLQHSVLTMVFVLAWSIDPLMWQRMRAVQTPAMAQKAAGIATAVLTVLFVMVIIIGLAAPAVVPASTPFSKLLMVTMAQQMPPLAYNLLLLGVVTALASTIDSSLNIGSQTLVHDLALPDLALPNKVTTITNPLSPPTQPSTQALSYARLSTLLILLPASVIALTHKDIIQVLWLSADVYVCGLFWPMMGLLFTPVGQKPFWLKPAGQAAMAVGLGVWLLLHGLVLVWPACQVIAYPYATLIGWVASGLAFGLMGCKANFHHHQ
jgi:solute:Na+ symporter, SSS family